MPYDYRKIPFFTQIYRYRCHIAVFFETNVLKEIRILCSYLRNSLKFYQYQSSKIISLLLKLFEQILFADSVIFTLSIYECSTFFFINGIFKTQKLPGDMILLLWIVTYKWDQKHGAPDTCYTNNDYTNALKFMKITLSST